MIVTVLFLAIAVLVLATLAARLRFALTKPAIGLTATGVLGALMFAISMEATSPADHHNGHMSWVSITGFAMASLALIGVLVLVLIWAVRKWGLPDKEGRSL